MPLTDLEQRLEASEEQYVAAADGNRLLALAWKQIDFLTKREEQLRGLVKGLMLEVRTLSQERDERNRRLNLSPEAFASETEQQSQ